MSSEVPDGWREAPFSELARYDNGRAFKPSDWGTEGLPIVRIAQITNPDAETNRYSGTVEDRHLLADGDLIFSWSATLAVLRWDRGPAVLNQHLFKVTPTDGIDRDWLQFRLDASIPDLADEAHGTTMKHIRKGTLSSQTTFVPPLDEQRRIAEVLRSLNEAVNSAQQSCAGYRRLRNAEVATFATESLEYGSQPLGKVIASMDSGWSPDCETEQADDEEWGVLKTSAVTWHGYDDAQNKRLPPNLLPRPSMAVAQDDILITRAGPAERTGVVAMVGSTMGKRMLSDKLIRIRALDGAFEPLALAELLRSEVVQEQFRALKSGMAASQTNISQKALRGVMIPAASPQAQREFVLRMTNLDAVLNTERCILASMRTVRLSTAADLLSGRVRVPA